MPALATLRRAAACLPGATRPQASHPGLACVVARPAGGTVAFLGVPPPMTPPPPAPLHGLPCPALVVAHPCWPRESFTTQGCYAERWTRFAAPPAVLPRLDAPPKGLVLAAFREADGPALEAAVGRASFGLFGDAWTLARHGVALVLLDGGEVVSAATTVAIADGCAEISVATRFDSRRRGFARLTAGALLADCAARGLVPSWHASSDESTALALGLGFRGPKTVEVFQRVF